MAKFFWSKTVGLKGKHWIAWEDLCRSKDEGGVGLRSLHSIVDALFAKLWWKFRTTRSLFGVITCETSTAKRYIQC